MKLVDKLIDLNHDHGTTAYAIKMREHLKLPMSVVLDNVLPNLTVSDKIKVLNVTRQCYYGWVSGMYRPDTQMSKKLAKLSGFSAEDIRGRPPRRR